MRVLPRLLFQAPSLEEHVDYHFIAFVEKDGILYDLDGRKPAPVNCGPTSKETFLRVTKFPIQCNLDLVTTCDLVTIFQRLFFNLLHEIIQFSDIMQFSDSFCGDQKCH